MKLLGARDCYCGMVAYFLVIDGHPSKAQGSLGERGGGKEVRQGEGAECVSLSPKSKHSILQASSLSREANNNNNKKK